MTMRIGDVENTGAPFLRFLAGAFMLLALAGCTGTPLLPSEGPSAASILGETPNAEERDYAIISVDEGVIRALHRFEPLGLRKVFGRGTPELYRNRIGIGDELHVTIWEAAESGLFSTPENKRTEIGPLQVDKQGRITIPFAGVIRAAGLTPLQLQGRIAAALKGKAISPQVLVSIRKNVANSVVVNGDVRNPGQYALSLKGDRVLDVIARAGGAAAPARETMVTLIRRHRRAVQNLKRIIQAPSENVFVQPGDQIYLSHNPQTFTAFGAVTKTGEYPFDRERQRPWRIPLPLRGQPAAEAAGPPAGFALARRAHAHRLRAGHGKAAGILPGAAVHDARQRRHLRRQRHRHGAEEVPDPAQRRHGGHSRHREHGQDAGRMITRPAERHSAARQGLWRAA